MTDKVQKIRAEIERKMKTCEEAFNTCPSTAFGSRIDSYKALLSFIDSLPEESKCIYNRTLEERKKFCKYCSAACDVRIEEEPETEDLIEEIDKIWNTCNPIDEGMGVETANIHIEQFDDIARHFVEWQKEKHNKQYGFLNLKDCKDAYNEWKSTQENPSAALAWVRACEWQKKQMKETLQTEYEKGRFDMREEIIKDAVDGEYWDGSIYLDNRPTEYKDGDRVKTIILKTEQQ